MPGWAPHFARRRGKPLDQSPHTVSSPSDFQLRWQQSAVSASVTMTAAAQRQGAQSVTLQVTLYRDQPYVDLAWSIHNKQPDQWPEAGWLCLPLAVNEPQYRLGRLGSVIDPAKDAARGSNFDVFCLTSGMTVAGPDGKGVGICPIDSPLVSIGHHGLYRHTGRFGTRSPVLFANLFNNVWGTNFQQWTDGSWSSRYRLWSVANQKDLQSSLITPSWEARNACLASAVEGPAGPLPPTRAGLTLSRKGVLLTAFGPNPDGAGTLLRLWEQVGQDSPCRLQLPEGLRSTKAQACDLRGRRRETTLSIDDGCFDAPLEPFAPASYLLE